jgi:aminopeptidase N
MQDEPAAKATFSVTLIVPQQQQALSNMPELSCTHMSSGRKKVVFDVTPVMSTYLLAFAVGVWDVICDKTK